jgi:lipoprotein signal peptidase
MWANVLLVVTNVPFLWTTAHALQKGQLLAAVGIAAAGCASMLYHGAESHKHQHITPGLGYATGADAQWWLLNLDRVCAALAFVAVFATAAKRLRYIPYGIVLILCAAISEVLAPRLSREAHLLLHALFHSIWHMGVFLLADVILSDASPITRVMGVYV